MIKVGLTGGIGCGKSYVADLLRRRHIPVYDTDKEAKRLMMESAIGGLGRRAGLYAGRDIEP